MRLAAALGAALVLAGCAPGPGRLPVVETVSVPATRFAAAQGEAELVVRAFLPGPEGAAREVAGADCVVTSILFSARLTTPAALRVPSFGPQSPTLVIDCGADGLAGRVERPVATRWLRAPGAWPGPGPWNYGPFGPYGPYGWGGPWGWDDWRGPNALVAYYPDVAVPLAPTGR